MGDYRACRLADVCDSIDYGLTASARNAPVGPKFLRITDIVGPALDWASVPYVEELSEGLDRYRLHDGDIVIARTGATTGESHFIQNPPNAVFASYLVRLKVSKDIDPRYVAYWLKSPAFRNYLHGVLGDKSAQPNASASTMTNAPMHLPRAKSYQSAVASVLGALDDKIELNRQTNETLEAIARVFFKDWFVDFGPTRAKMEGREPYLAPELWDLFPDRLDDAIGLPEGWKVIDVGEIIELLDHKRVPLSSRERAKRQGVFPYHGATGVMDFVDDYLFDERLLLLGEDGSVTRPDGRPFTQYVWGKIWVNNHAHVLRGAGVSVEQLKCFFEMVDIGPFVTGAVQPKLNQANLRRVPFMQASGVLHQAFDDFAEPLFAQIRANTEETRTLGVTRDLLLPKLMSGEIRLRDAEKIIEEAL